MNIRRDLLIVLATVAFIAVCWIQLKAINTESYKTNLSNLYKIDSVGMLDRAFSVSGAKGSGVSGYEFEDENGNKYRLEGAAFKALQEDKKLYDTLQYSNLVMTILTDNNGIENYQDQTNNGNIAVLDIIIDGKSYVDLQRYNDEVLAYKKRVLLFLTLTYITCVVCYFYYRKP